ncbi:MAG: ArnT family glycosyltransferase [Acidimicrobiales bacterium]
MAGPIATVALVVVVAATLWVVGHAGWSFTLTPKGRLAALAGAVIVPAAALGYLLSTSGFVWDDIQNLREAQLAQLTIGYLGEPTFGHFSPGHRLADWAFFHLFSFDFTAAAWIMVIGFALTLVLFHRVLAELFRPGAGPLVLTLVYGVSLVHVGTIQWWAAGIDRVCATALSFLSILGYLLYRRKRSWRYLVLSLAALGLAEMFYVKPVFVPLYLVLMRVLLLEPERRVRDTIVDAAREWRVWALYAVTVGAFAAFYLGDYPEDLRLHTSPAVFAHYLSALWFRVLVPNFFGIWLHDGPASGWTWTGVVVAQVLLAGVVAWSIWRWRPAWRAWVFFAIGGLANAAVVGMTRVGLDFADLVAYTLNYNLEIQFLFVLALGAAFLRRRSTSVTPRVASPTAPLAASPVLCAALGVAVSVYVAVSWWSGNRVSEPASWIGARSRVYLDAAGQGIDALRRRGTSFALVDGVVPYDVAPYALVPYNNHSEVFPLIDDRVAFDPTGRELYEVTAGGVVRPVTFVTEAGGDPTVLLQRQLIGVLGATPRLEGGALCVTAGEDPATIGIVSPAPLTGDDLALRLRFDARTDAVVSMLIDPRPVQATGIARGQPKVRVVNVASGADQTRVFALDAPDVRGVYLVVSAGAELCLDGAELGRVVERRP